MLFKKRTFFASAFSTYLLFFVYAFQNVVFKGQTFAKRDIFRYYHPVWKYSVDCLKHGHLPLWNPYNYFGTPFFANIQTCVLYPATLILYLPHYTWAFNFYILFHLALASFFCCLWMIDCGASKPAAFLSGFAFGLSGYLMSAINLTISLCSVAYFPLILLLFRRASQDKRYFWKGLCGVAMLLQYLAGDPAVFITSIIVMTVFTGYKTLETYLEARRTKSVSWKSVSGSIICLFQIFLTYGCLGAFHYPLFAEFLFYSNRVKASYDQITMWSVQLNDLVTIFVPFFSDISIFFMDYWQRQSWLEHYYSGITVLLLGTVAWTIRGKKIIGYHTLLALFGISLCLGRFSGIFTLFYHVFPLLSFVRYPARFFFLFSFAAACLAGFGFDQLMSWTQEEHRKVCKSFVITAVVLTGAVSIFVFTFYFDHLREIAVNYANNHFPEWIGGPDRRVMDDLVSPFLENLWRTVLLAFFMAAIILAARFLKPRRRFLAVFLGMLVFADLYPTNVIEQCLPVKFLQAEGKNPDIVKKDQSGIFRVMASPGVATNQVSPRGGNMDSIWQDLIDAFTPNSSLPKHFFDCLGYDSLFLEDNRQIHLSLGHVESPETTKLIDALNVKYLAGIKDTMGSHYELLNKTPLANLYLNRHFLSRAFFVTKAVQLKDRDDILRKIIKKNFHPEDILYIEGAPPSLPAPGRERVSARRTQEVVIEDYKPERIVMKVRSSGKPWLFFSDPYYPGWTARIDGKRVKIYKANYAFRTILVPPGTHEVVWTYEPILFKIGASISLLTVLFLLVYYFRRRPAVHGCS